MDDCIFCKIVKGDIPSAKIHEDDEVLAFLDIQPANKGHALVVPKRHYATVVEIPDALDDKMLNIAKKIAKKQFEMGADGVNILQNNKETAGQVVHHLHFHVIPRYKGDGLKMTWPSKRYEEGEMESYIEKLKT